MTNLAIVVASVVKTSTEPYHYRYTLFEYSQQLEGSADDTWEGRGRTRKQMSALLRYSDVSIEDVLLAAKIEFGLRRGYYGSTQGAMETIGDDTRLVTFARVDGSALIEAKFLGEHLGHKCYLLHVEQNPHTLHYFGIAALPNYGNARLVYAPDVVRDSFESLPDDHSLRSIMTEPHAKGFGSEMTVAQELDLFNFIDAQVAPKMELEIKKVTK